MRRPRAAAAGFLVTVALAASTALVGCTGSPATDPSSPGTTSSTVTSSTGAPVTSSSTRAASSPDPTYFTPPESSGYTLSGPVAVEQARQDPFSNLLLRGALHQQPVTLDVVATPDYPVTYGQPSEILFGTCKCPTRGQGLRVTVKDGAAVRDGGGGKVAIVGRFTATVTAQDAVTLSPAG